MEAVEFVTTVIGNDGGRFRRPVNFACQEVESMVNQQDVGTRINEHLLLTHIENDTGSDGIALNSGVYCVILPVRLLLTVGVRRWLGLRDNRTLGGSRMWTFIQVLECILREAFTILSRGRYSQSCQNLHSGHRPY
jgi:hypothetical protein